MNNTNAIFLAIGIAAVLAIVVAPAMIESASAAIRDACEKNDRISEGDCEGNTAKTVSLTLDSIQQTKRLQDKMINQQSETEQQ